MVFSYVILQLLLSVLLTEAGQIKHKYVLTTLWGMKCEAVPDINKQVIHCARKCMAKGDDDAGCVGFVFSGPICRLCIVDASSNHIVRAYVETTPLEVADVYLSMDSERDGILEGSMPGLMGNGARLVADCIKGAALKLDGIGEPVSLGEHRDTCFGDLRLCPDGITVSFWVTISSPGSLMYILDAGGCCSGTYGLAFWYQPQGELVGMFRVPGLGKTRVVTSMVGGNSWYHIVGVWAPDGSASLYVNGLKVDDGTLELYDVPTYSTLNTIEIGGSVRRLSSYRLEGMLDEVEVFYGKKSHAYIRSLYIKNN